ncbi:MAG: ice-binding family protein [Acidimicrobiales bacterium]
MNTRTKAVRSHQVFDLMSARGAHRRPRRRSRLRMGFGAFGVCALSFVTLLSFSSGTALAATAVNLGSAAPYAVLAGSTITNTGASVISGDIGLSPGTSITGFPPGTVSGTTDKADSASLAAMTASTDAYAVAAAETPFSTVAGGTLGGTLSPGTYQSGSSLSLTGTLTLNGGGNANAVFIFQAGSTLTTATGSAVILENGAQACNVFWQVGSSATLGTSTAFAGTILAQTSATLDTGATLQGRVQAQSGAVTLDDNTISVPTCSAATPTTTTTTPTTTTTTPTTTTTTPTTTTTTPTTTTTTTTPVAVTPTSTPPSSTGTVIPVGAPATGEGGGAGPGSAVLGLIGLSAVAVAAGAASVALRSRRDRRHGTSGHDSSGS